MGHGNNRPFDNREMRVLSIDDLPERRRGQPVIMVKPQ